MPDETRTELQDMTDADLVRLCRQGRHEAFDVIALRYLGVMHAVALARLADRDAAEDLVQEVLLRVFLHLDRLKKPDSLGPWITQITRNMARNWLRDGRTRSEALQLVPLDDVESQLADDRQKGAPKTMQEDETQTAIEKAIMALKPDDRELVLLYYAEEM
ncbi:MAG: RNA polymerase sigma factor, partial [Candidatus Sumerlaeia bacterium]